MGCARPPGKRQASVHKRARAGRRSGPCPYIVAILMTLATDLMRIVPRAHFAVAWIALSGLLAGCSEAPKQAAPPPPKVTVAKPVKRTIVDQDEYVGRFVAVDSVEVRARVSGYLDKVQFE